MFISEIIFHSGIPILESYLEETVKNTEVALRNCNAQYTLINNYQNY